MPTTRRIPSDDEIYQADKLFERSPDWRNIYRIIALFGLRPHECWQSKIETMDGEFVVHVLAGKTGARIAFASRSYWLTEWVHKDSLTEIPALNKQSKAVTNKFYGQAEAQAFRRHKVPFGGYDLRHAYGIRSHQDHNIPLTLTAKSMGNSPETNQKYYQIHSSDDRDLKNWKRSRSL
jgi:integrase